MIIMDEHLVGIWFMPTTEKQDWMCGVREIKPDEEYQITYRFRYYEDGKVFDSEDKKKWYEGKICGTRAYVIASIRSIANTLYAAAKIKEPYEMLNDGGDIDQFSKKFMDAPFVFARLEPKEELKK